MPNRECLSNTDRAELVRAADMKTITNETIRKHTLDDKSCSADKRHCPLPPNIYHNSYSESLPSVSPCKSSHNDCTTLKPKSPFTSKLRTRMQPDPVTAPAPSCSERFMPRCCIASSLGPRAHLQLFRDILPSGRRKSRGLTSPADTHDGAVAPRKTWSRHSHQHWRTGVLGFVQPHVGQYPRDPIDSPRGTALEGRRAGLAF